MWGFLTESGKLHRETRGPDLCSSPFPPSGPEAAVVDDAAMAVGPTGQPRERGGLSTTNWTQGSPWPLGSGHERKPERPSNKT
eukprot:8622001-Pyramimonas_sp.AAC.1